LKERFIGKIIYWNKKKGFGFVKPYNLMHIRNAEIFIHQSEIISVGQRHLKIRTLIEFSRGLTRAGNLCAVQVTSPGGLYLFGTFNRQKEKRKKIPNILNGYSFFPKRIINSFRSGIFGPKWLNNILENDMDDDAFGITTLLTILDRCKNNRYFYYEAELVKVLLYEKPILLSFLIDNCHKGHISVRTSSIRTLNTLLRDKRILKIILKMNTVQKLCIILSTAPTAEIFYESSMLLSRLIKGNILKVAECLERDVLSSILPRCKPSTPIVVLQYNTKLIKILCDNIGDQIIIPRPIKAITLLLTQMIFIKDKKCLENILSVFQYLASKRIREEKYINRFFEVETFIQFFKLLSSKIQSVKLQSTILRLVDNILNTDEDPKIFSFIKMLVRHPTTCLRKKTYKMINNCLTKKTNSKIIIVKYVFVDFKLLTLKLRL